MGQFGFTGSWASDSARQSTKLWMPGRCIPYNVGFGLLLVVSRPLDEAGAPNVNQACPLARRYASRNLPRDLSQRLDSSGRAHEAGALGGVEFSSAGRMCLRSFS